MRFHGGWIDQLSAIQFPHLLHNVCLVRFEITTSGYSEVLVQVSEAGVNFLERPLIKEAVLPGRGRSSRRISQLSFHIFSFVLGSHGDYERGN